MHNEEYEMAYKEAREALYRRGKRVGGPLFGPGCIRHCSIDGFPLSDRDLLKEAWGESLADEIIAELRESDSLCCCVEG